MALKHYTASADTTIVNAFKSDLTTRGTGSNMGKADVVEVFSVYARQSTSSQELSRVLMKFPIDDISTDGMNIEEAVKLIRGQRGTKVKLEILRGSKSFFTVLLREKIEIKSVSSKVNQTKNGLLIGYVRIKQFNANASKETKDAIKDLEIKKVAGYVLDLRSNPGGLLESSIDISRHFINKGVIVSTVSKDGLKETKKGNGQALTKKPLVVLVNEGSASASEIVSGAIKDNKRGKLVGKKTFGKGLVQSMRTLVDGSGLTVTVAKYLTPNGTDINKSGIIPDIEVKMNINPILQREIGTRKDKQYRAGEKELLNIIKRNIQGINVLKIPHYAHQINKEKLLPTKIQGI